MKYLGIMTASLFMMSSVACGGAQKEPDHADDMEEAADEAGDDMEEAADDAGDQAEEIGEDIEDSMD